MIRQKDFTYDPVNFKGLPEFVRSIKKDGLRYVIILVCVLTGVYILFLHPRNELAMRECHHGTYVPHKSALVFT